MKRTLIALVAGFCFIAGFAKDREAEIAENLAKRIVPRHAALFRFETESHGDSPDSYSIENRDGKILITGNNANSMAVGLNHYLKRFCNTTVSWYAEIPVEMPDSLPVVDKKITGTARVERRFFLNYCTFGYTMPFWDWTEWERLIDWMALNGINMPLAITGQEAVWYEVWKKLGMTDEEIRGYFTGPVYLPWHRMANIDAWNGPLPKEWLDKQRKLQQRILDRERSLGMRPVLPAFAGHVPAKLKELFPNADIKYLGKWAGFKDEYRCHFLNPGEPLFAEVQRMYLEEQTRLFGTDHIYGVDPFNEVDPPSWEPEYLLGISQGIYRTLTEVDPQAEWMQMSWMFYHDKKDWTAPRIEALLKGVPTGKMSLIDYHCENVELWRATDRFHGQPYIWCYLGNFGGNTTMTGNVKKSGVRLDCALKEGGDNLRGIGATLEGLDVMQFPYEYVFEKAWTTALPDEEWIANLADRHAGTASAEVRGAWKILFDDIYVQVARTLGVLPNYRPALDRHNDHRIRIDYDNRRLAEAWRLLLETPDAERDAMKIDLIVVGRQVLGNLFSNAKFELDSAYHRNDRKSIEAQAAVMREILSDLDSLNAFHPRCSLNPWLEDARRYGTTPETGSYYEKNARNLITTWGGALNDYASRTWAGLIRSYYAPRWEIYLNAVSEAAKAETPLDEDRLKSELIRFENEWVESGEAAPSIPPKQGILDYSRHLYRKYSTLF